MTAVFQPGVNVFGFTLTFQKDYADVAAQRRGNHDWRDEITVADCVVLEGDSGAAQGVAAAGMLYFPRGAAVVDNMRFWHHGIWYGTRGPARYDFDHVLTRENFGYVEMTIVKGG